ncbi:MAG: diaminopimelate epimerase [Clostridia bacterium]|jgi:diaminopimelate epimerase|nr:diaminopimelate epimerase [Clostridia bacterium]
MQLNFVKLNPSGNTTVLILDSLPRSSYQYVASQVMRRVSLAAEQVGFIEAPISSEAVARLQMMGGEFCGNAVRCFATWLVERQYPGIIFQKEEGYWLVPLEISGHQGVLNVQVVTNKKNWAEVKTPMPVPQRIQKYNVEDIKDDLTLVSFTGITHVVAWNTIPSIKKFNIIKEKLEREEEGQKNNKKMDALGVMFYQEEKQFLTPLVFVKSTNSLVWENSCGSGTVAIAAALAAKRKQSIDGLSVLQPGGEIGVKIKWDEDVEEAEIFGEVNLEAEGIVYVK